MSPAKKALPRLESDLSDERGAEEKQSSGLLSQFGIVYGVLKKEKFVTLILSILRLAYWKGVSINLSKLQNIKNVSKFVLIERDGNHP